MASQYKWTVKLILFTPLLLFVAVLSMGAGHGTYIPSILLFPFGMLGVLFQDRISLPFIIIGILQFPVYGYIIDKALPSRRLLVILLSVLLAHVALVVMLLKLVSEDWK